VLSTLVIAVAGSAVPPGTALMARLTAGESAIGSLNAAKIVSAPPAFTAPAE
jgi:hypothetical protein